jgi:hypothetical protein
VFKEHAQRYAVNLVMKDIHAAVTFEIEHGIDTQLYYKIYEVMDELSEMDLWDPMNNVLISLEQIDQDV